jgi:hypothetical protein
MRLPAPALATVLFGSSAAARAATTTSDAGRSENEHVGPRRSRHLQKTKIDGDCDDDRLCGLCVGDCDDDSNCEGNLVCKQRDDGGKVPGCRTGDDDRPDVDYCYDPNWNDENDDEDDDIEEEAGGDEKEPLTAEMIATPAPSVAPAKVRPGQSEGPTVETEGKPRTWATILTEDMLVRNAMTRENKILKLVGQETDPFRFTEQPSTSPSHIPSARPSLRPSQSFAPSSAPTKMRKEECKIEMYYERKWCWHDDAMNRNCDHDFRFCAEAEDEWLLEMEECDNSPTTWLVWGHTIRPKEDKDLCWTRRSDNGVRLMPCDEDGKGKWESQRFAGMCEKEPTKITPLGDKNFCMTSGHEPRDGERIKFQECDKVDNSNTHLWIMK